MAQGRRYDRTKELFWRRMVRGHAGSGLSVRGWCRRHDLKEPGFHWWRRELARRDARPILVPVRITGAQAPSPSFEDPTLEIILVDGRRVRVRGPVDRAMLADVLAVLMDGQAIGEARAC